MIIDYALSSLGNIRRSLRLAIWRRRLRRAVADGLQIGEDCNISKDVFFGTRPFLVKIGSHVEINAGVTFITHAGADEWLFGDLPEYSGLKYYDSIEIKDNCFVGIKAIVLPGVTIGPNSIVGAGAVVTRDVQPNTVVIGNPAQPVSSTSMYMELMRHQAFAYDKELRRDKKAMRKSVEANLQELNARRGKALSREKNGSDRLVRRV